MNLLSRLWSLSLLLLISRWNLCSNHTSCLHEARLKCCCRGIWLAGLVKKKKKEKKSNLGRSDAAEIVKLMHHYRLRKEQHPFFNKLLVFWVLLIVVCPPNFLKMLLYMYTDIYMQVCIYMYVYIAVFHHYVLTVKFSKVIIWKNRTCRDSLWESNA